MCETIEMQPDPVLKEVSVSQCPPEQIPEVPPLQAELAEPEQLPKPLPAADILPDPVPVSKNSKRLPYWIMAVLFIVGFVLFLGLREKDDLYTDPDMPWFSISQGVLYFDDYLYTGPEELTVPESIANQTVTMLSAGCFAQCTDLITTHLPQTLQIIGDAAFLGCTALRGVYIPGQVVSIGDEAFAQCGKLESLVIPCSVQYIGNAAFEGCGNLLYIFYGGPEEAWRSLYAEPIAPKTFIYTPGSSFRHTTLS